MSELRSMGISVVGWHLVYLREEPTGAWCVNAWLEDGPAEEEPTVVLGVLVHASGHQVIARRLPPACHGVALTLAYAAGAALTRLRFVDNLKALTKEVGGW